MLVLPPVYTRYSWISIDPGLSTCGFAIFTANEHGIESIEPFTITNSRIGFSSDYPEEHHLGRSIRIHLLCLVLLRVLQRINPIAIVSESPFYNPRMPGAFGSLTELVAALRLTVASYNVYIPFIAYAPQEVKQSFKRSGQIGKVVMKEALEQNDFLCSKLTAPLETLDEHSIDAIAVGYTWWLRLQT